MMNRTEGLDFWIVLVLVIENLVESYGVLELCDTAFCLMAETVDTVQR